MTMTPIICPENSCENCKNISIESLHETGKVVSAGHTTRVNFEQFQQAHAIHYIYDRLKGQENL